MIKIFKLKLLLFIFFLTSCQSWFYRPSKDRFMDPRVVDVNYQVQSIKVPWSDKLHGWLLHSKQKSPNNPVQGTVAFFYDASKNITHHFRQVTWLTDNNFDVYLFDYPGFGESTGELNPQNLVENVSRVIEFVRYRKQGKFVVLCQSTGGLLCAQAVGQMTPKKQGQVDLLVFDNAYASYRELMKYYLGHNWWSSWTKFMVPLFLSSDNEATDYVSKIRTPTLVIHAENNQSVPYQLGYYIYDNLNTKKYLWKAQKVGHLESFEYPAQQNFFLKLLFHSEKYLK